MVVEAMVEMVRGGGGDGEGIEGRDVEVMIEIMG